MGFLPDIRISLLFFFPCEIVFGLSFLFRSFSFFLALVRPVFFGAFLSGPLRDDGDDSLSLRRMSMVFFFPWGYRGNGFFVSFFHDEVWAIDGPPFPVSHFGKTDSFLFFPPV